MWTKLGHSFIPTYSKASIMPYVFIIQGYLLASHLARLDLVDVHTFCRQQGLLHLGRSEPVRSLVVWREVFPASCNRGLAEPVVPHPPTTTSPYHPPQGRWFLLIVGKVTKQHVILYEGF